MFFVCLLFVCRDSSFPFSSSTRTQLCNPPPSSHHHPALHSTKSRPLGLVDKTGIQLRVLLVTRVLAALQVVDRVAEVRLHIVRDVGRVILQQRRRVGRRWVLVRVLHVAQVGVDQINQSIQVLDRNLVEKLKKESAGQ